MHGEAGALARFAVDAEDAEAARAVWPAPALGWGVVLGALLQVAGIGVYFWTMWSRIRPVGSHLREAKGERF